MTNMNSTHRISVQTARSGKRRSVLVKAAALTLAIATFASVQQEASATDQTRRQALVFFQKQSHREAIEGEHEQASLRVRAQQNLFHEDQEEREVQPEEAAEHASGEASR